MHYFDLKYYFDRHISVESTIQMIYSRLVIHDCQLTIDIVSS